MTPSSSSLFHYTKQANSLFGIIEHGFRYSYCFEVFDETVARFINRPAVEMAKLLGSCEEKYGIAIPMICFCDIPISRADSHRANYGDFCIGLNKEIVRAQLPNINPVLYQSSSWIMNSLKTLVESIPRQEQIDDYFKQVEPLTQGKNTIDGASEIIKAHRLGRLPQLNFDAIPAVKLLLSLVKTNISKYDEREWRVFWEENIDIKFGLTEELFNQKRTEYNNQICNRYATFDSNIINHIIVPTESCGPCTIDKIKRSPTILGKAATDDDKEILITKITTFERIDNDF